MDCIFCKIIKGEIPSLKVYEDNYTLAFLDINPVNFGHTLVVPKKHFINIDDADQKTLCRVVGVVKRVGSRIKESSLAPSYNIQVNNGQFAGQIVMHLHFHVIPRLENDGLKLWPQKKYGAGEAEEILNKIKIT
jgi:histidine triad (HIT) family protein